MKLVAMSYLFVAFGGALGAMARFGLNIAMQRDLGLPAATLTANLLGCFLMGVIAQLVAGSEWFNAANVVPDQYRLLFAVGFCGSFTTLSALMLELHVFLQRDEIFSAFSYLVLTFAGGFACFYFGVVLARLVLGTTA
jgi:CrcB protein